MGVPLFSWFGRWSLVLYLHVLVKAKFFSENSNLSNLVKTQRYHENDKWIICISDGVYELYVFLISIHSVRKKFPSFWFICDLPTKKCNDTKNYTCLNLVYTAFVTDWTTIEGLCLFWFSEKIAHAHISGRQNKNNWKKNTWKVVNS